MVYNKICLMLPTYKRKDRVKKFLDSAIECADSVENLCAVFCVNESDNESADFIMGYGPPFEYVIIFENTQQPNLAMYYNMMYNVVKFNEPNIVVSMVGDDMVFKTKGYDTAILKEINEKNGDAIIYCNDDYIAGDKLCVNLFTTRKVVDATQKPFMCPSYHADMIDVVWTNVGLLTGILKYLPDVILKHEHESVKAKIEEMDETCKRLMPLRAIANNKENRMYGWRYAHVCAANLIDVGIGKWVTL